MRIAAVAKAFPPNRYDQEQLLAGFRDYWGAAPVNLDRLEALHRNVLVGTRHLALPMEQYPSLTGWGEANSAFIRVAVELGERAVIDALAKAHVAPADVGAIFFVTVTGIATPSIEARLVNRVGLSPNVKRIPIFGLGCVAGAAGIARAADYVRAFPREHAVLLSVELCSLTLQRGDLSVANLIASGLFGDGAAAVVISGAECRPAGAAAGAASPGRSAAGPRIVATRSVFYPDTERVMGWDVSERGFRIVLSSDVPVVVRNFLCADVDAFLAEHDLRRADIAIWICHPGGPKVLEAMSDALELPPGALDVTWRSLKEVGNLSSVSVLCVLQDTLEGGARPPRGSKAMLLAMGPGFCSELVLLEW